MVFSDLEQDPENLLKFTIEFERKSANANYQEQIEIRYLTGEQEVIMDDQMIQDLSDKNN